MITAQRRVWQTAGTVASPRSFGHLLELARDEREFLQRGDDDRHGALQRLGELARALVDLLDDAVLVLELVDRVLQLLVEHHAVGDHDDAVEDPLVVRASCSDASRWASQPIVLLLPLPAECSIR